MSRLKRRHWRVEVLWDDSTIPYPRWTPVPEILKARRSTVVSSVGVVLADDDKGMVVASSVHGNEAVGVIIIPRGCIRKVKRLR